MLTERISFLMLLILSRDREQHCRYYKLRLGISVIPIIHIFLYIYISVVRRFKFNKLMVIRKFLERNNNNTIITIIIIIQV